ncbi:MAG: M20/M25/M40 family metallo-hydrolase [Flavobacteriia bacterium]|nr:M20/M25/M40 family metallo-hydrolase [Flavobacteriia bacterium]
MKKTLRTLGSLAIFAATLMSPLHSQSKEDLTQIKKIFDTALSESQSYEWLNHLSNQIGGRLSGSVQAAQAVSYTEALMKDLQIPKVWKQDVMVPKWVRGTPEFAYIELSPGVTTDVPILALGGSVATPSLGIKAAVVEVQGLEDLAALGEKGIKGKIVFFNRPMDPSLVNTFAAYSGAVDQRSKGAAEAAKYGALGVVVRSMNLRLDDYPHTGGMSYGDLPPSQRIPAAAISTNAAEYLSTTLKLNPALKFYFKQSCSSMEDVPSHNVIGEIKGSEFPEEIIVVGGHLDSWDVGDGAHDDGAGCVQSIAVLEILKKMNYTPKRTIRVVMFMNEENGLRGGTEYANIAKQQGEKHIFALESDAGGFTPRGFSVDASEAHFNQMASWSSLFEPYFIPALTKGGSGADIGPLKEEGMVLAGLRPDSQRYFDHHHAATDTFDGVNKRELDMGAAAMTALVYLYDTYGLSHQENE